MFFGIDRQTMEIDHQLGVVHGTEFFVIKIN